MRRIILGILIFGVMGTAAELLLLSHDEGALQLIPLVLIAVGLLVIFWHLLFVSPTSLPVAQKFALAGALLVLLSVYLIAPRGTAAAPLKSVRAA